MTAEPPFVPMVEAQGLEIVAPLVTVDLVIFSVLEKDLKVLLLQRTEQPFSSHWALPGGLLFRGYSIEAEAFRLLEAKTGVKDVYLEQLYTFGGVNRDPRGWAISVSYFALIAGEKQKLKSALMSGEVRWWSFFDLPPLAFDHQQILCYAYSRLKNKLEYSSVGFQLLPEKFTFPQLKRLYEIILRKSLDKRNFRKRVTRLNILEPLGETRSGKSRPARLYRFREDKFGLLKEKGILFPLG